MLSFTTMPHEEQIASLVSESNMIEVPLQREHTSAASEATL
jgi:hypothetical protein